MRPLQEFRLGRGKDQRRAQFFEPPQLLFRLAHELPEAHESGSATHGHPEKTAVGFARADAQELDVVGVGATMSFGFSPCLRLCRGGIDGFFIGDAILVLLLVTAANTSVHDGPVV